MREGQQFLPSASMNDYYSNRPFEENYFLYNDSHNKTCPSLEEIFQRNEKKVLIIGEAGVGKTTWCKRIAYLWSTNDIKDENHRDNHQQNIYSSRDRKFLCEKFKFCFVFRLRNITQSLHFELMGMCDWPFNEQTCNEFIVSHKNNLLFVLGKRNLLFFFLLYESFFKTLCIMNLFSI